VAQVQVALLRLLRADTILVGHSLEQDLMVVRLMHLRYVQPTFHPSTHPPQQPEKHESTQ
jgi:DNA polymerase III epsilon subunit-like protein